MELVLGPLPGAGFDGMAVVFAHGAQCAVIVYPFQPHRTPTFLVGAVRLRTRFEMPPVQGKHGHASFGHRIVRISYTKL